MEENNVILKPELGASLGEVRESGERLLAGLSVGGCSPFGGRARGGDPNDYQGRRGVSVGQAIGVGSGVGCANAVVGMLNRIGAPACRVWGAPVPDGRDPNGCPRNRKVCGAIYPYFTDVPDNSTNFVFNMLAKVWFWPLFWADSSAPTVRVAALKYTGDPVFENGVGSGPLNAPALFGASSFYGFVPGMPAFDNSVPLVAELNSDATPAQNFRGMFIGISIRN